MRLFEHDPAQERDGVGGPIGLEIEARERQIDRQLAGAVAAGDLERGHGPLRVRRRVVARACPLALLGQRGQDRAENAVGFLVLRIDGQRVFGGGDRFRRLVLPRVEPGELGPRLGALRIEGDRLAQRGNRLVDLAATLEVAAEQEVVGRVLGGLRRRGLRKERKAESERQQGHYWGR